MTESPPVTIPNNLNGDHIHTIDSVHSTSNTASSKKTTKKPRRKKKKSHVPLKENTDLFNSSTSSLNNYDDVEIEYIPDTANVISSLLSTSDTEDSELIQYFGSVFAKFEVPPHSQQGDINDDDHINDKQVDENTGQELGQSNSDDDDDNDSINQPLSNRKLRKAARLTVAELKQLVDKPEVVDWVDVTAPDPKLLVDIKSTRNTVAVPVHWSQKRKYLQNKRGLVKEPFKLPDFILATGILEMREALNTKDDKLKAKMRERVQPKMGKLVIDYAKLHAAFFKWQTKPSLTLYGDMYYEGKEFETKLKHIRPGAPLSTELCEALGMPSNAPPPYLIHMQRHGPPPSYPGLKIPGLNAPIPPGAAWGFHPGGWGKPPVDEYGRPIYGDVYGTTYDPMAMYREAAAAYRGSLWGEINQGLDDNSEIDDQDNDDDDDDDEIASDDDNGLSSNTKSTQVQLGMGQTIPTNTTMIQEITSYGPNGASMETMNEEVECDMDMEMEEFAAGLVTPAPGTAVSGMTLTSSHSGIETETPMPPRELYAVVDETLSRSAGAQGIRMGSDHVYEIRKRPVTGIDTETPMPGTNGTNGTNGTDGKKRRMEPPIATSNTTVKPRRDFKF